MIEQEHAATVVLGNEGVGTVKVVEIGQVEEKLGKVARGAKEKL